MAKFERGANKTWLIQLDPALKGPLEQVALRNDRSAPDMARVLLKEAIQRELHGRL